VSRQGRERRGEGVEGIVRSIDEDNTARQDLEYEDTGEREHSCPASSSPTPHSGGLGQGGSLSHRVVSKDRGGMEGEGGKEEMGVEEKSEEYDPAYELRLHERKVSVEMVYGGGND